MRGGPKGGKLDQNVGFRLRSGPGSAWISRDFASSGADSMLSQVPELVKTHAAVTEVLTNHISHVLKG